MAIFITILLYLGLPACQETASDQNPKTSKTDPILDSLIHQLEQWNALGRYDTTTRTVSLQILERTLETHHWKRGGDALYHFMVNGDWTSDTFYARLDSLHSNKQIPDSLSHMALYYMAYLDFVHDRITRSKELHEKYAAYCRKNKDEGCIMGVYDNLGNIAIIQGDYDLASRYFLHGLSALKEKKDSALLYEGYNRLAQARYYAGEYTRAQALYERAQTYREVQDNIHIIDIAHCLIDQKKYDEGLKYLRDLNLSKADTSILIEYHLALGKMARGQNLTQDALREYQSAHALAKSFYETRPRERGKVIAQLADVYYHFDRLEAALNTTHEAMATFIPTYRPLPHHLYLPHVEITDEIWIPELLGLQAKIFYKRHRLHPTQNFLDTALTHLYQSIHLFQKIASSYIYEQSQLQLSTSTFPLFESWLSWLEEDTVDPRKKMESIFQVIRKSQAFSLKQIIREKNVSDLPKTYLDTLQELEKKALYYQSKANEVESQATSQAYSDSLFFLEKKIYAFRHSLSKKIPQYNSLQDPDDNLSLKDFQSTLSADELALEYFLGDETIYTLGVTRDTVLFQSLHHHGTIPNQIQSLHTLLAEYEQWRENPVQVECRFLDLSRNLYLQLLGGILSSLPEPEKIKKLTIGPSGALSYLPFDVLLHGNTNTWLDVSAFLIHKYIIQYRMTHATGSKVYSLKESPWGTILTMGIDYTSEAKERMDHYLTDTNWTDPNVPILKKKKMASLTYARREAEEIAHKWRGKALLNEEATKDAFIRYAPEYSRIHISSHALIDPQFPSKSCLVLSPHGDNIASSFLHGNEIGRLNLNCDMVVLSACETASGPVVAGEGILSIARYFQMAGCQSVVASQWSVPDQSTYEIMLLFYDFLHAGQEKSEALRNAKLEYLRNDEISTPNFRVPHLWASFCLFE